MIQLYMQNTNPTSRELYNSIDEFSQYLVDQGYLTIIDGQLTDKSKPWCMATYSTLLNQYKELWKSQKKRLKK